jgi:hypothetical protein
MAIFCGTILLGGDRTDLECTILEPPEPLNLYMYRCSSKFELEPLLGMLEEKDVYVEIDLKPALSKEQLNVRLLREFKLNSNKSIKNILKKFIIYIPDNSPITFRIF